MTNDIQEPVAIQETASVQSEVTDETLVPTNESQNTVEQENNDLNVVVAASDVTEAANPNTVIVTNQQQTIPEQHYASYGSAQQQQPTMPAYIFTNRYNAEYGPSYVNGANGPTNYYTPPQMVPTGAYIQTIGQPEITIDYNNNGKTSKNMHVPPQQQWQQVYYSPHQVGFNANYGNTFHPHAHVAHVPSTYFTPMISSVNHVAGNENLFPNNYESTYSSQSNEAFLHNQIESANVVKSGSYQHPAHYRHQFNAPVGQGNSLKQPSFNSIKPHNMKKYPKSNYEFDEKQQQLNGGVGYHKPNRSYNYSSKNYHSIHDKNDNNSSYSVKQSAVTSHTHGFSQKDFPNQESSSSGDNDDTPTNGVMSNDENNSNSHKNNTNSEKMSYSSVLAKNTNTQTYQPVNHSNDASNKEKASIDQNNYSQVNGENSDSNYAQQVQAQEEAYYFSGPKPKFPKSKNSIRKYQVNRNANHYPSFSPQLPHHHYQPHLNHFNDANTFADYSIRGGHNQFSYQMDAGYQNSFFNNDYYFNFDDPKVLNELKRSKFFIMKSYSKENIFRSIESNVWCSTPNGNAILDEAFENYASSCETEAASSSDSASMGGVYLLFSINASGCFCGVAKMTSKLDRSKEAKRLWVQDKWDGAFSVKWLFVKNVPNKLFLDIRIESNENKPVTNSRDSQQVPSEQGIQVLSIIQNHHPFMSIYDDYDLYANNGYYENPRPHPKTLYYEFANTTPFVHNNNGQTTASQIQAPQPSSTPPATTSMSFSTHHRPYSGKSSSNSLFNRYPKNQAKHHLPSSQYQQQNEETANLIPSSSKNKEYDSNKSTKPRNSRPYTHHKNSRSYVLDFASLAIESSSTIQKQKHKQQNKQANKNSTNSSSGNSDSKQQSQQQNTPKSSESEAE